MSVWQLDHLLDEEHLMDPQLATSLTIHTLLSARRLCGVLPFIAKNKGTAGRQRNVTVTVICVGLNTGVCYVPFLQLCALVTSA